jgi:glycogen debranching enzyme
MNNSGSSSKVLVTLDGGVLSTPFPHENLQKLIDRAHSVLLGNWIDGWTRPSPSLFPHQWNWDSGFVALGYLHLNPEQAYQEIRSLFRAQWIDGFLPHIVFNNVHINHFPGPDYWRSDTSGRMPPGIYTSGIGQPPVHASILVKAFELDPDRSRAEHFLRDMYPRLCELHDFYYTNRDPDGEGLVSIIHPWESGLDHSNVWRDILEGLTECSPWAEEMQARYDGMSGGGQQEKTRCPYIASYSYLVERLFTRGYHWKTVLQDHPFVVQNVLFNSVLCRAERDLGKIAEILGENPEIHLERSERAGQAINNKLWNAEIGAYCDWNVVQDEPIPRVSVFSFLPLYAGIVPSEKLDVLCSALTVRCLDDFDSPSLAATCGCESCKCWRGPVWVNVCWYIIQGLRAAGKHEEAEALVDFILNLADQSGFFEYFTPDTGEGMGEANFSWSAALVIDLAAERLQFGAQSPLR